MKHALKQERSVNPFSETIRTNDDVLQMLDAFFPSEEERWNKFFSTLPAEHPLSTKLPDESLVEAVKLGKIPPGKAFDIGCGNGRNSFFLEKAGFNVDALDLSIENIKKAKEHATQMGQNINFICSSLFEHDFNGKQYDLVYDAGLLHHIFPHRRPQFIDIVSRLVKKGGYFGLVAFNEKDGTKLSDWQMYNQKTIGGGISFSKDKLIYLLGDNFKLIEYREMKNCRPEDGCFGFDFLLTSLWEKL